MEKIAIYEGGVAVAKDSNREKEREGERGFTIGTVKRLSFVTWFLDYGDQRFRTSLLHGTTALGHFQMRVSLSS